MIRVVVATLFVVGHDDVGPVQLVQLGEPFGRLLQGHVAEHVVPVLVLPVGHAGVVVAEHLEVGDAERFACPLELAPPDSGDLVGIVPVRPRLDTAGGIAELAVGAGHHDGPQPLGGVAGENSASAG